MNLRTFVACAALICGPALMAEPTPPTPAQMVARKVASLTALLTLNPSQQTAATTIFTTEETALSTIRTSMDTLRSSLTTAVNSDDASTIAADAAQIGSLTAQEVQTKALADAAFYILLSTDQQTRFKQLQEFGGPHGIGGPNGPGHPGQ